MDFSTPVVFVTSEDVCIVEVRISGANPLEMYDIGERFLRSGRLLMEIDGDGRALYVVQQRCPNLEMEREQADLRDIVDLRQANIKSANIIEGINFSDHIVYPSNIAQFDLAEAHGNYVNSGGSECTIRISFGGHYSTELMTGHAGLWRDARSNRLDINDTRVESNDLWLVFRRSCPSVLDGGYLDYVLGLHGLDLEGYEVNIESSPAYWNVYLNVE